MAKAAQKASPIGLKDEAAVVLDALTHKVVVAGQSRAHGVGVLLPKARAAFDVGEQERDGVRGRLTHGGFREIFTVSGRMIRQQLGRQFDGGGRISYVILGIAECKGGGRKEKKKGHSATVHYQAALQRAFLHEVTNYPDLYIRDFAVPRPPRKGVHFRRETA